MRFQEIRQRGFLYQFAVKAMLIKISPCPSLRKRGPTYKPSFKGDFKPPLEKRDRGGFQV